MTEGDYCLFSIFIIASIMLEEEDSTGYTGRTGCTAPSCFVPSCYIVAAKEERKKNR